MLRPDSVAATSFDLTDPFSFSESPYRMIYINAELHFSCYNESTVPQYAKKNSGGAEWICARIQI
jgi:hypothetical protein